MRHQSDDVARRFAAVWKKGIDFVNQNPQEARKYLAKNTLTPGDVVDTVPMVRYFMAGGLLLIAGGMFAIDPANVLPLRQAPPTAAEDPADRQVPIPHARERQSEAVRHVP